MLNPSLPNSAGKSTNPSEDDATQEAYGTSTLPRKQRQKLKRKASRSEQAKALPAKEETLHEFLQDRGALESLGGGYSFVNTRSLTADEVDCLLCGLSRIRILKIAIADSELQAVSRERGAQ